MEQINNIREFNSRVKYALAVRMGSARKPEEVPTVGLVFGNLEIATQCHEYFNNTFDGDKLKIHITQGTVTSKIEIFEFDGEDEKTILSIALNCDQNELMDFKENTPAESRLVLVFGFKHQCDYYIAGNFKNNSHDFLPIVLSGYKIIEG